MAIFGPSVRALMSHINSVKALNDIRDTVTANLAAVTAKDEAWATAAAGLLDGDVDIWRSCLKPIFMERLEVRPCTAFSFLNPFFTSLLNFSPRSW